MKNQKGITLVALVITIIVLLILAGVSISLVIGQNGILSKATNAVETNEKATLEQEVKLALADCEVAYYAAWVNNQAIDKNTYYQTKSYYDNNIASGTVTNFNATATEVTGDVGSYQFKVTIATGTVEVTEK